MIADIAVHARGLTATIEPFSSADGYGKPSYGTAATYRVLRVVGRQRIIRSTTGQEVTSSRQVYLATASAISGQDRITMPSGYDPQQPPILGVELVRDEAGAGHHTVVYV